MTRHITRQRFASEADRLQDRRMAWRANAINRILAANAKGLPPPVIAPFDAKQVKALGEHRQTHHAIAAAMQDDDCHT